MRSEAGPSRNPGRPQGEGRGREAQAPPTVVARRCRPAPGARPLLACGRWPRSARHPGAPILPSPPPHPVGSSEAGPKNQSRDQRAQTAASSGSAPGGRKPRRGGVAAGRGGEGRGRRGSCRPRASGPRAPRASAERASRGGAPPPPRPISGRRCRRVGGTDARVSRRR